MMTTTAIPRQGAGTGALRSHAPAGAASAAERELVLLLCGTQERRRHAIDRALALLHQADTDRLMALLERLRLTGLAGRRLPELGAVIDPRLDEEIERWSDRARDWEEDNRPPGRTLMPELRGRMG